jgi:uncharacterized protein with FMN-binding domain
VRRIVLWVLSTLSALVALLGYHTSTSSVMATGTPDNAISGSLQGQASTRSATGSASGSGSATSGSGSSGSGSSGSVSGSASGSAGQSSTAASTVTGDSVGTPYGPVQVRVAVDGSTITDVTVLQYPDQDGHSVQINQYALPQLINETLDAQGSGISMVSGATYTSQGYLQSLQSALDQAGL